MADMKFKLRIPSIPNYISIESPPGLRQEGFKENSISIADISDELLSDLADEWKAELIRVANLRRVPKDVVSKPNNDAGGGG